VQIQVCSTTATSSYSFLCPACRLLVNKPAGERIMEVLVSAGVHVVSWSMPAELDEVRLGPPICYDDLLAFHFELSADDWFERLLSSGPEGASPTR
jgi:hypothetical protein